MTFSGPSRWAVIVLALAWSQSALAAAQVICTGNLLVRGNTGHGQEKPSAARPSHEQVFERSNSSDLSVFTREGTYLVSVQPWWGIHHKFSAPPSAKKAAIPAEVTIVSQDDRSFSVSYQARSVACEVEYE